MQCASAVHQTRSMQQKSRRKFFSRVWMDGRSLVRIARRYSRAETPSENGSGKKQVGRRCEQPREKRKEKKVARCDQDQKKCRGGCYVGAWGRASGPVNGMEKVCGGLLAGWAQAGWCLLFCFCQDLLLSTSQLLFCLAWPWGGLVRSFFPPKTQVTQYQRHRRSRSRSRRRGLQTLDTRSLGDWCVVRLDSR
ncbi:hypothetical protein BDP81DRAFT_76351 [Colletotrichum phormii]|uniref:Uncharacterized protein n=1 Tax=Colletotrichum phormii TaxID=359342 RepID=A0AAJ0EB10_9PEZI|nr:uncharacterized protein BDP81DRAFT_76351 [Colletotrichum phormii]KAK1625709.1 hypothetical protein BDP81DRAFT_76351 [Colletotrichum phormii]